MAQDYWEQRREEILAFRDYVQGFDLAKDEKAGVWLAESGHQLMETAFQLTFLGQEKDGIALAERAMSYYETSLTRESSCPETDARMASVYQRLYYAGWWVRGEESREVVEHAANAFCNDLTRLISPEDTSVYVRAALLWLEVGDLPSSMPWMLLAQESALQEGGFVPDATPWRKVLSGIVNGESRNSICSELLAALSQTTAWGQATAGTLWDALQLANIHRRLCSTGHDFAPLLSRIR